MAGPQSNPDAIALGNVDDWVFDLDNTLYPASCNLFRQVDRRIGEYIQGFLGLEREAARSLQRRYFLEHGSSLRGMMINHAMKPGGFLAYVHDIDMSPVPPAPALDTALESLPGRKIVFTNGSTAHAERVLGRLGVTRHFAAVFDIIAADYLPKPQPATYRRLVELYGIEPTRAVLVEDLAQNLVPAAALGMITVWVAPDGHNFSEPPAEGAVHHVVDDLAGWLSALTENRDATGR
jgi:putative hydrolase of the HAD superfamily